MDLASLPGLTNGTDVLALVGLMSFLIAAVAAVAAMWRSSRNNATLQNLKDATESYKLKAEAQDVTIADMRRDHDAEVAGLNRRLADKDAEVIDLRGRLGVLQEMVTGRTALEQLAGAFDQFAQGYSASEQRILAAVASVQQAIDNLSAEQRGSHDRPA